MIRADLAALLGWVTAPAALAAALLHPRLRPDWRARTGRVEAGVEPGCLWIHAASVGEMAAAEGLLGAVRGPVLLTADTDTGVARGRAIARQRPRTAAAALPIDHPWLLAPLFAEARPRGLVLVEGAWWPNLIAQANLRGIPVIRANARPGSTTWLPGSRWWAGGVDLTLARDPVSARSLSARVTGPVECVGDLKLLRPIPPNPLHWPGPFWVAASTRPADEPAVLGVDRREPLLWAPRHLERVPAIRRQLAGRRFELASRLVDGIVPPEVEVVILDRLGFLAGALRGATVVFVGGTFDRGIGGHSPAEAFALGLPVAAGPHTHSHPHLFEQAALAAEPAALADALARARPAVAARVEVERLTEVLRSLDRPGQECSPRPWARPLAPLVAASARIRRATRSARRRTLPVPVWVVGSDNPRGSGKTATAAWWAEAVLERGGHPGIAVRGFGRRRVQLGVSWEEATADALGDEGAMLARRGFVVAAHADLAAAAHALVGRVSHVIVDDGAGSALSPDRLLAVVDARYPTARGPLPAGERRPGPLLAHGRVVHHAVDGFSLELGPRDRVARRVYGAWHRGGVEAVLPPGPLAVFAGLGRPSDAISDLERPEIALWPLADHQRVDRALADALGAWAGDRPLVCTAKDRVRLPADLAAAVWWRDARVEIDDPPEEWFR